MYNNIENITEDWENVKRRWEAWWQCDIYDRTLIMATAPKEKVDLCELDKINYKDVWEDHPEREWTDIEQIIRRILNIIAHTYYGGEAVPIFRHKWSVGHALLFGSIPHFSKGAVWCEPVASETGLYPEIQLDRTGFWRKWMVDSLTRASTEGKGRYYLKAEWGSQAGDVLSAAYGDLNLMMAMADNPEWVKKSVKNISENLIEFFSEIRNIVNASGMEGSVNYTGSWSPKRTLAFDCDISCMISNEKFKEIFLEPLVDTMNIVDHRIYHLDGPGAIKHLDTILGLPELHAIQWVPGAGKEEIKQWLPLIKHIQEKRKAVLINAAPQEIELLLKELYPYGLCIDTECRTESEACSLIEKVEKHFKK